MFQKFFLIGKDCYFDGDVDLFVYCDVIFYGVDVGRNDGVLLVWGCKFFYVFVIYCVIFCLNYEFLFYFFFEVLIGGNIQKELKNVCIVQEIQIYCDFLQMWG